MAKWYTTNSWSTDIEEREITRHTEHSVFYVSVGIGKERSSRKRSDYLNWFPTQAEAARFLIDGYAAKAKHHEERMGYFRLQADEVRQKYPEAESSGTPQQSTQAK